MAFLQDDEQDPSQPGGVSTSQGSGVITGGAPGAGAAAPQAKTGDKSGSFVGLKQYLDANKTQAGKLGDQTAGVINSSADQARQGIGALNQEASDKVKGVNNLDSTVSEKLMNTAENLTGDERNTIKNTAAATYKGPENEMGLSSYQNAASASNKANQNIANSGTEQGRMSLIGQVNAKPRTQGENVFDNALLQAGGGREKLAQAANANQDVKGALDQSAQNIRGQIGRADDPTTKDVDESSGAIGQTNKAQADAYKKIQDAMTNWNTGLQGRADTANAQRLAVANELSGRKDDPTTPQDESLQFSQGLLDQMGLKAGDNIYNTDIGTYLNPNQVAAQGKDFINQNDLARYQALQDLSGGGPDQQLGGGYNPYANIDKAGLQGSIAQKKQTFDNAQAAAVKNADTLKILANSQAYSQTPEIKEIATAAAAYKSSPTIDNFNKLKAVSQNMYNYYKQYPQYATGNDGTAQAILALHDQAAPIMSSLGTGKQVSVKG